MSAIVTTDACQIKILQNPKAAETMSSQRTQNQIHYMPLESGNSIDKLSKASPYFQEHSTFELTRKWEGDAQAGELQKLGIMGTQTSSQYQVDD